MRERLLVLVAALLLSSATPPLPPRHVIYVHGRIVQEQESARPKHEQHGYYEFDAIAEAFRKRGFAVTAERRKKGTTVADGADHVVNQVRALLDKGVPPERITVIGASMGAAITQRVAARLQEPGVRFVVMGPCIATSFGAVASEEGRAPAGRILSIRDESDVPSSTCPAWSASSNSVSLQAKELVIDTGLGHGYLYRPLPEWVEPAVRWATD
jgi:alpha-beta hydrolase superfamily lysophospholipase